MVKMIEDQAIRNILFASLNKILQVTKIDDVSTSQIITGSGISRSTFYRHFYDKYDLLNQCYQDLLDKSCETYFIGNSFERAMEIIFIIFKSDLKFFQNAFTSNDENSLKNYVFNYGLRFVFTRLSECGEDINDWKLRMLVHAHIYGATQIMVEWIMNGALEPISDMIEIFRDGYPTRISKYF